MRPVYQPTSVTRPVPPTVQPKIQKTAEQPPCSIQNNVTVTVVNQGFDFFGGLMNLVAWFFGVIIVMSLVGFFLQKPLIALALLVVCGGFYALVQLITRN